MGDLQANPGKNLIIKVGEQEYARYPVKTSIVKKGDDLVELFKTQVAPHWQTGDLIAISEKIVAISQGRSYLLSDIKPGRLAKFLVKFVHKSPYGIGLGSPYTMELAVREVGPVRMLVAAAVAAITKPFGIRGMFYRVAGKRVNAIDGPCEYSLPPSNQSAKLPPANPEKVVLELKEKLNHDFVIIDANDLGVEVLGNSSKEYSDDLIKAIFKDNPLGQASEQTPVAVVRRV
ncbi:MAG TPA: coenzyme F420-0:L-glutamate ligase [bacterium]|nr:coenzyme F420-0:L-glutamate ligase [bacterium]